MTREQKITMVAGITRHTKSFITELVRDNDALLERMVTLAKATINQNVSEEYVEAMS